MGQNFPDALAEEIASLELRLRELKRVSALYASDPTSKTPSIPTNGGVVIGTPRERLVKRPSSSRERALAEALAFVKSSSRMMPTREILNHLVAKGIDVGGASPLNNLSAMISTSGKFQPHGRSGWTIANSVDKHVSETSSLTPDGDTDGSSP